MFVFRFVAIGPFLAEIHQVPYLTLESQGQGHEENNPNSTLPSCLYDFIAIRKFKLELSSGIAQNGAKIDTFRHLHDLENWWMTLKINRGPLPYPNYVCVKSEEHPLIQNGVIIRKHPKFLKSGSNRRLFGPCDLETRRMTLKNNRVPLPCLYNVCVKFEKHLSIITGVMIRKQTVSGKTLFWPLWPWPLTYDLDILPWYHSWH